MNAGTNAEAEHVRQNWRHSNLAEEAEHMQTKWDFENTVKAAQEFVERLEMAKRPDLAAEARQIGVRFTGGLR